MGSDCGAGSSELFSWVCCPACEEFPAGAGWEVDALGAPEESVDFLTVKEQEARSEAAAKARMNFLDLVMVSPLRVVPYYKGSR